MRCYPVSTGSTTWRMTIQNVPNPWNSQRVKTDCSCNANEVTSHSSVNKAIQCDPPSLGRPMAKRPLFFACSLCALSLVSFITQPAQAAQTGLDLPQPNGCYAVGVKTLVLSDASRHRDLVVTFWYPATAGTLPFAPYMDKKTADAVAEEWKLQPGFERQVRTHSRTLAPVVQRGPFPIVFLEHGTGVVPSIYTILAEGLASSGFVVVATNHTPDSLISVFPDGHEVRFKPYWPTDADRRTQGEAIGKFAEDVLVRDVRFVLDKLGEIHCTMISGMASWICPTLAS